MDTRIGIVTNVFPSSGRATVYYEDTGCTSMPLATMTYNNEYSMPSVGERVVTLHMENGSSKGFILGTFYGGGKQPKAVEGYHKDMGGGAYTASTGGNYELSAGKVSISGSNLSFDGGGAKIGLSGDAELKGGEVNLKCSYGSVTVEQIMKRLEAIEDMLGLPHTA